MPSMHHSASKAFFLTLYSKLLLPYFVWYFSASGRYFWISVMRLESEGWELSKAGTLVGLAAAIFCQKVTATEGS